MILQGCIVYIYSIYLASAPVPPWDYQGDHLSLPPYRCAAYRGRILGRNWDKSFHSFPTALPWDYQGDHLLSPPYRCAAYRGRILGRVIETKVSIDSFPQALPWDYQGDHLSSHHTDAAYRGRILGVIGTKVLIVFLQRSHGAIREITSSPTILCAAYKGRILGRN